MVISNNLSNRISSEKNTIIIGQTTENGYPKTILTTPLSSKVYSNHQFSSSSGIHTFMQGANELIIYVYNFKESNLLYTNQVLSYNSTTNKYEIYGYFPTTLKNCNTTITESKWQTLQLDSPILFKYF